MTCASFHFDGKLPDFKESLKIVQRGKVNAVAHCRKKIGGSLSGPAAFDVSISRSFSQMVLNEIENSLHVVSSEF